MTHPDRRRYGSSVEAAKELTRAIQPRLMAYAKWANDKDLAKDRNDTNNPAQVPLDAIFKPG